MGFIKQSTRMQKVITQIAEKHGLDLTASESHLRLELSGFMPLVIEKIGKDRVSVAHYYTQNGDAIADPDIVFWVAPNGEWYPCEVQMPLIGYREYIVFKDGKPASFYQKLQHDLATFSNQWASNIREQDYLRKGVNSKASEEA